MGVIGGVWGGKWQNPNYLPNQNSSGGMEDGLQWEEIVKRPIKKEDIGVV